MIPARNYIVISALADKEISPCWLLEKLGWKADRGGIYLFELLYFLGEMLKRKSLVYLFYFFFSSRRWEAREGFSPAQCPLGAPGSGRR